MLEEVLAYANDGFNEVEKGKDNAFIENIPMHSKGK